MTDPCFFPGGVTGCGENRFARGGVSLITAASAWSGSPSVEERILSMKTRSTVRWSGWIAGLTTAVILGLGGAATGAAAAGPQIPLRPDLVAQQPNPRVMYGPSSSIMWVSIENRSLIAARATTAKVTLRPVTKIVVNGRTQYLDAIASVDHRPVVTGTGAIDPLAGFGVDENIITLSTMPGRGLHRVTVCADSAAGVSESDENNNCSTIVADVNPTFIGG